MFSFFKKKRKTKRNIWYIKRVNSIGAKLSRGKKVFLNGKLMDVGLSELKDLTEIQKEFFVLALKLNLEILGSQEFYDQFLAMDATEKGGFSQQDIYENLLSSANEHNKIIDYSIDLVWCLHGNKIQRSETLEDTYESNLEVWLYRYQYFKWMRIKHGPAYLAAHMIHRYLHHLGFTHTKSLPNSLVCKTDRLIRDLGIQSLRGRKLTQVR